MPRLWINATQNIFCLDALWNAPKWKESYKPGNGDEERAEQDITRVVGSF